MAESPNGLKGLVEPTELVAWLREHLPATGRLVSDSRRVGKGDAFFALHGRRQDGSTFIAQAVQQGAAAVVVAIPAQACQAEDAAEGDTAQAEHAACGNFDYFKNLPTLPAGIQVPVCYVPCLGTQLGALADEYYDHPSQVLDVVAVTGTNGKTSTTHWIAQGVNDRLARAGDAQAVDANTLSRPAGASAQRSAEFAGLVVALDGDADAAMQPGRGRGVVIGTNGVGMPGALEYIGLTTPDPLTLQTLFQRFRADIEAPVGVVAMEASSIGLVQGRMQGTCIHTAVFTNLTRDHLDYHGSMQAYGAAKVGLFSWPTLQAAVINLGDPLATEIIEVLHRHPAAPRIIGYWVNNAHGAPQAGQADAAFQAMDDDARARLRRFYELAMRCDEVLELALDRDSSQHVLMMFPGSVVKALLQLPEVGGDPVALARGEDAVRARQQRLQAMFRNVATLRLNVLGRFNMENALAAAGAWRSLGWNFPAIVEGLHQLHPVPGRMEIVGLPAAQVSGAGEAAPAAAISSTACPLVVVDYAHTPDALTNVLTALRDIAGQRGGQLCCVFGAGGNRDRGKRPEMARAVEAVADRVVVTSDNPRDEDPAQIIADVCQGLSQPAWRTEADRRVAIDTAIAQAEPADVVLIAGKGRETTQEIAGVFHPFSDPEIAAQALASHWTLKTREVPHA
ncbi:MAG: Mur ligase family protein [Lautropia mirabilis]